MDQNPDGDMDGGTTPKGYRRPAGRRRRWLWPIVGLLVLVIAAGAFYLFERSRTVVLGAISPASGTALNAMPVIVSCELIGLVPGRGSVSLTVDGRPVSVEDLQVRPGSVVAKLALPDGGHTVVLTYDSSNVFSRHLSRTWDFDVDTTAPGVTVAGPASFPLFEARSSDVSLTLSEPAGVSLTLDGELLSTYPSRPEAGPVRATITAADGTHVLTATVTDRAGNVTRRQWDLTVDSEAPKITAEGLPQDEVWKKANAAAVTVRVADYFADRVTLTATLDGETLALKETTPTAPRVQGERDFTLDTGTLPEGTHQVVLSAVDIAGHETTVVRDFLVDTSETFGARSLTMGAVGGDVKQLQRILAIKGTYDGPVDGEYGQSTASAVEAFNTRNGLDAGPVVTKQTLDYLLGSIVIDLSERKLYLYGGDGKVVKTYRVAVGMPQYPTPTGDFRIITKEVDPTWDPPNSAWAKGMGPVPPGPDNPLGTRWMGLNSPGIGIHGTPAPSSIGTAASHGCIRMRIPEAEDLFGRVFVGTPVKIVK